MKQKAKWSVIMIALIAIVFFWNSILIYPLKILSVFFHESSHAVVALVTHGKVHELTVNQNEGGHVLSSGGNALLTYNAGYLGNLVIGCLIVILATRTKLDKALCWVLGLGILAIGALYIRSAWAAGACLVLGVGFIALGKWGNDLLCKWLLVLIGLHSALYAIADIKSDVLSRSSAQSDAWYLAQNTGIPVLVWGVGWIALSVVCLYFSLRFCLKPSDKVAPTQTSALVSPPV